MTGDRKPPPLERLVGFWNANAWDAMGAVCTDDVVVEGPEMWPESEDAHGWPAVRQQFERLKSSWSEERIELVEKISNGDCTFVKTRWITKGQASGVPIEADMFSCYWFREGLVERIVFTTDRAKALAIAGIEGG
jgi:ketosteroid isomerase-like protein